MRIRHGVDLTIERLIYVSGQLGNCRAANNPADKQDCWLRGLASMRGQFPWLDDTELARIALYFATVTRHAHQLASPGPGVADVAHVMNAAALELAELDTPG